MHAASDMASRPEDQRVNKVSRLSISRSARAHTPHTQAHRHITARAHTHTYTPHILIDTHHGIHVYVLIRSRILQFSRGMHTHTGTDTHRQMHRHTHTCMHIRRSSFLCMQQ